MLPNPDTVYWDDWLLLLIQLLSLLFLLIYVAKTWQMAAATRTAAEASALAVRESTEARLENLAPRILVYFDGGSWLARITIQNAGQGTAENLRLEFDPSLQSSDPKESIRFFDTTQPVVPPGYRHSQTFDTWPQYLQSDLPRSYVVTARFRGAENGRDYEVRYTLDAEAMRHRHIHEPELKQLTDEVKKMRDESLRTLREIGTSLASVLRFPGWAVQEPRSLEKSVRNLLGTWQMLKAMDQHSRVAYPIATMSALLRIQALQVAQCLPETGVTSEQRAVITPLLVSLFEHEAEYLRHDDQWTEMRDAQFMAVANIFELESDDFLGTA